MHRQKHAATQNCNDDLHAALHLIRYGIVLLDRDYHAVFINRAFRHMWRLSDTVAESRPSIAALFEHGWAQGFYKANEQDRDVYIAERTAQIKASTGSGQIDLELQDGRTIRFESITLPIGQRMLTYADVTPLIEATRAAKAANRAKAEFLSGMSHELRTPLNAVIGFAQLLAMQKADTLGPKQAEFVSYILSGGRQLLSLIDDILKFAKLDAGHLPIDLQAFDPVDLVTDLALVIEPLAAQAGIAVQWPDAASGRDTVYADPVRTTQVLLNLLSNAVKYNRPQGNVRVDFSRHDDCLRLSVQDNGIGIPFERQGEVFQAFNRLGRETCAVEGSGIGLALSKKLAEAMNGHIGFSSRAGFGSKFWIDLPLADDVGQPRPTPMAAHFVDDEFVVVQAGGFSVLYIEDHVPNQVLMEHVLATLPAVRFHCAATGSEGLAIAYAERPDIVIVDINLPDMNGFKILESLSADPRTAQIPVVALTSEARPEAIERGHRAGFALYLTKPIDLTELFHGLDRLLRSREICRRET